jgi:hypothetical protein
MNSEDIVRPAANEDPRIAMAMEQILTLQAEHRMLDKATNEIETLPPPRDELQLKRLKKRKLQLKDQISSLKIQLQPDIPA